MEVPLQALGEIRIGYSKGETYAETDGGIPWEILDEIPGEVLTATRDIIKKTQTIFRRSSWRTFRRNIWRKLMRNSWKYFKKKRKGEIFGIIPECCQKKGKFLDSGRFFEETEGVSRTACRIPGEILGPPGGISWGYLHKISGYTS